MDPNRRDRPTPRARALACGLVLLMAVAASGADEAFLLRSAVVAGPQAQAALQQLRPLLQGLRTQDGAMQLFAINQFFNRHIEFSTDLQAWGRRDCWASPFESMQMRRGECEDYAIAKYFSLLAAGMPVARLRLVYVRAQLDDGPAQAHMVLAYFPPSGGETLILDNLVDDVLPASRRTDLVPLFSFNSDGLWQGLRTVGAGDPSARLSRWRKVLARARAEAFL